MMNSFALNLLVQAAARGNANAAREAADSDRADLARAIIEREDAWRSATARLAVVETALTNAQVAFEIIAGKRQCLDNLMGNADVAEQALGIIDAALNPKTEAG